GEARHPFSLGLCCLRAAYAVARAESTTSVVAAAREGPAMLESRGFGVRLLRRAGRASVHRTADRTADRAHSCPESRPILGLRGRRSPPPIAIHAVLRVRVSRHCPPTGGQRGLAEDLIFKRHGPDYPADEASRE